MKPIAILPATALLCLSISISQATPYSAAQFKELVATKYLSAIKNYNGILGSIVNQLKDYNPETSLPKEIDPSTTKATEDFVTDLTTASQNAESMSKSLDSQVEATSAKVSQVESQIQQQQSKIETTRVQVQRKEKEIALANQRVNNANSNVATFEHAVYEAKKRKEKAKCHCFRRRRKRGFFKSLERKIRCGIKGPICKLVSAITRDLKKAKKDLKKARKNLASAKAHVQQATADKNAATQQHAAAKAEVARLTKEKEGLMVTLTDTKTKRDGLVDVSAKLKRTLISINELKGHGHVLKTNVDLGYLFDVDSIAMPLRELGQKIATLNGSPGQTGFLPSLTPEQISDIRQKLELISKNKEATMTTAAATTASTTTTAAAKTVSTTPAATSTASTGSPTAPSTTTSVGSTSSASTLPPSPPKTGAPAGPDDLDKYVEKVDLHSILGIGASS